MLAQASTVWGIALLAAASAGCSKSGTFDSQPLAAASTLARTDVQPSTSEAINPQRNYVYCATFELGWDELRGQLGKQPVQLQGDPGMARILNDHPFDRSNIAPDDYLVVAGRTEQGIIAKIRAAMASRFPHASLEIPDPSPESNRYIIYAYLAKHLRFAQEFDVMPGPFVFRADDGQAKVVAFEGHFESMNRQQKALRDQVTILDYRNDNDFILRLNTTSKIDELILAKISPAQSLRATIETVQQRIQDSPATSSPQDGEHLIVPMISLAVERNYKELTNRRIENAQLPETIIASARQDIRFCLDERGARVESVSKITMTTSPSSEAPRRMFIFDRPFLLYMQQKGATAPYFAMWIANGELLKRQ
ncbi:MAG TPA: hypothetical protein VHY20_05795 [Pirellulales bacterium]|nr:hypothetical protein [Pirellulales bacterium]